MKAAGQPGTIMSSPPQGTAMVSFFRQHEIALYAATAAIGLSLRLAGLSAVSLNDWEAAQAWAALHLARGQIAGGLGATNPLYAVLTAALFFAGGPSDFLARLVPALAGTAVVLLPLLSKKVLTRTEAIVASLLLAVSPGIAAISHLAGGTTLALLPVGILVLLAAEGRLGAHPGVTGVCAGLALATGSDGLTGCLLLALAVAIVVVWTGRRGSAGNTAGSMRNDAPRALGSARFWIAACLSFAAGVTGLLFPAGLGVFASGLQAWFATLVTPGEYTVGQVVLLLLGYEGLAFLGCLAAVVLLGRERANDSWSFLLVFLGAAVLWLILRPGRAPGDALWVIFPMVIFASKAIDQTLRTLAGSRARWASWCQLAASLALGVFAWQSFAGHAVLGWQVPDSSAAVRIGVGLVAILAMLVLAGLLGTSWSENLSVAAAGLGLAVGILLLVGQVSAVARMAGDRRGEANELWWPSATTSQLSFLVSNLQQISEWQTGTAQDLPMVVSGDPTGALGWALRSFPHVSYALPGAGADPAVYLSPEIASQAQPSPPFSAAYMGEPFTVQAYRVWGGFPPDLLAWWIYRMGPTRNERVILWVRQDVQNPGVAKG